MDKFITREVIQKKSTSATHSSSKPTNTQQAAKKRKISEEPEQNKEGNNPEEPNNSKKKRLVTFKKEYEEIPLIRPSHQGNTYAFCAGCSLHFSISHGGRDDITKHTNSAKHKRRLEDTKTNSLLGNYLLRENDDHSVIRAEVIFTKVIFP